MTTDAEVLEKIRSLAKPAIIAISGFGGSGKSTVAEEIGKKLSIPVIGIDSFTKARDLTDYSLWENVDFKRFEDQVLVPFTRGDSLITYGHFDWGTDGIHHQEEVKNDGYLIVEGVGLLRPELMKYFSYTIWVDCPLEEAIARGKKRDREVHLNPQDEKWDGIWKKNDLEYLETFTPNEKADLIINNCSPL